MTTEAEFRADVVRAGLKQVGQPYRDSAVPTHWPPDQFDCSTFTHWCLSSVGVDIDRGRKDDSWPQDEPRPWRKYPGYTLTQQKTLKGLGAEIKFSEIKPGDLLYYDKPGEHHVTMYIGDGKVVHAAGRSYGVIVSSVVRPGEVGHGGKTLSLCVSVTKAARAVGIVFEKPAPKPPVPVRPKVDLSRVQKAARTDPGAKQGHKTAPADVKVVERALHAERLLPSRWVDGSYGTKTVEAYARWQRRLGFTGNDADGIPGRESLRRLGKKHGFDVTT